MPPPPPKKHSWDIDENGRIARARATRKFCEWLHDPRHAADRTACTLPKLTLAEEDAASEVAKAIFAREGDFLLLPDPVNYPGIEPIPAKTKFKIYEFDPRAGRDELVNVILPPAAVPFPDPFAAIEWYPCTYWPYL